MSSSSNNQEIIGTLFPVIDENDLILNKNNKLLDQTVRDERGKRRFHGAFTGGFSAGYWNTVGSAEGFTPKIFKSSRNDRYCNINENKPEDYMDDEDFSVNGIAPKKIYTKNNFIENFTDSSIPLLTFDDVIKSIFDNQNSVQSIGKRLYRRMKYRNLSQMDRIEFKDNDENQEKFLTNKTNRHGLGYNQMLNKQEDQYQNVINQNQNTLMATMKNGKKLKIFGQAFGYGALEDDDDDDDFDHFNQNQGKEFFSKYDFEIGYGKDGEKKCKKLKFNNEIKQQIDSFKKISNLNSNKFEEIKKKYPIPIIPEGYQIRKTIDILSNNNRYRKSRWDSNSIDSIGKNDFNCKNDSNSCDKMMKKNLNANLRSLILNENIVEHKTGVKNNVEDKELEFSKIITNKSNDEPVVRKTVLTGYFAEKFTNTSSINNKNDGDELKAGLNTFKNISQIKLFNNNKMDETEVKNVETIKQSIRKIYEWHPHKLLSKRFGLQNPYPTSLNHVGIVYMNQEDKSRNMLTRIQQNDQLNQKSSQKSNVLTKDIFSHLTDTSLSENRFKTKEVEIVETENNNDDDDDQQDDDDDDDKEEQQKQKPSIDLFKSIFESDNDDDDDQDEDVIDDEEILDKDEKDKNKSGLFTDIDFDQMEKNFNPRLNDDNSSDNNNNNNSNNSSNNNNNDDNENDDDDDDECYGPKLPPTMLSSSSTLENLQQSISLSSTIDFNNKEKEKHRHKKLKKLKKHHHHHHHHRRDKHHRKKLK